MTVIVSKMTTRAVGDEGVNELTDVVAARGAFERVLQDVPC